MFVDDFYRFLAKCRYAVGIRSSGKSETPVCAITLMGAINITMNKNGHFD
jgi:hypothetical protein